METSGVEHTLRGHSNRVYDVAFTPDGSRLVSSSSDGAVKMWDPESGEEVLTLRGHTLDVPAVSFHPGGWLLATARFDETVKVWDATPRGGEHTPPRLPTTFNLSSALERCRGRIPKRRMVE